MSRVLGVDLGSVRVGLAVSDPGGVVASPLDVVRRGDAVAAIASRASELDCDVIVIGVPTRMDGTKGPEAEGAERFAAEVADMTKLRVELFDERLSTIQAERAMRAAGSDARKQRGSVDKVAAALVLQAFLDLRRC